MVLIRLLTLEGMRRNVRIYAKYVNTKDNGLADTLSRGNFARFRRLGPHMEKLNTQPPGELWPIHNVWLKTQLEKK